MLALLVYNGMKSDVNKVPSKLVTLLLSFQEVRRRCRKYYIAYV